MINSVYKKNDFLYKRAHSMFIKTKILQKYLPNKFISSNFRFDIPTTLTNDQHRD